MDRQVTTTARIMREGRMVQHTRSYLCTEPERAVVAMASHILVFLGAMYTPGLQALDAVQVMAIGENAPCEDLGDNREE